MSHFSLTLRHEGERSLLIVSNQVGEIAAKGLLAAVICLSSCPLVLVIDLRRVDSLEIRANRGLLELARLCQEREVLVRFICGTAVRQALDGSGLWWLGRLHDGLAAQQLMEQVFEEVTLELPTRLGRSTWPRKVDPT